MTRKCIACGKNIGLLTVRIPLLEDDNLVICSECFEKMPSIIDDLYQKRVSPAREELLQIKEDVIQQLTLKGFNSDIINMVVKFLDEKISKAKTAINSEDGKILKKCPICKKNVNYNTEICSDCGYAFENAYIVEYKEIAKIYNERREQYRKNPFYEYDYIVVSNRADGTTDREAITEIIQGHAMQGWRLVTMYSNEIGTNEISVAGIGSNVTMCEDILVFERCIKEAGETGEKPDLR